MLCHVKPGSGLRPPIARTRLILVACGSSNCDDFSRPVFGLSSFVLFSAEKQVLNPAQSWWWIQVRRKRSRQCDLRDAFVSPAQVAPSSSEDNLGWEELSGSER